MAAARNNLTFQLQPHHRSVPRARAALHAILGDWHLDQDVIDTAELVLSELVTNAVRVPVVGGCARVEVRISHLVADGLLRLAVSDAGAGCPQLREPDAEETGGRGLLLVAALAHRWGWETRTDGPGKAVWAELKAPGPAHDFAEAEVVAVTVRAGQWVRLSGEWRRVRLVRVDQYATGGLAVLLTFDDGRTLRLHAGDPVRVRS